MYDERIDNEEEQEVEEAKRRKNYIHKYKLYQMARNYNKLCKFGVSKFSPEEE